MSLLWHLLSLRRPFMRHTPAYQQTTTKALCCSGTQPSSTLGAIVVGVKHRLARLLGHYRLWLWLVLWGWSGHSWSGRPYLRRVRFHVLLRCSGIGVAAAKETTCRTVPGFIGKYSVTTSTPPGATSQTKSLPRGVLCLAPGAYSYVLHYNTVIRPRIIFRSASPPHLATSMLATYTMDIFLIIQSSQAITKH